MSESEFRLHIKTTADLKSAKELEAVLQKEIALAKEQGKSTKQQEQQLKSVRAEIKRYEAETTKAAQATSAWTSKIPGLSTALEALKNPVVGLIGLFAGLAAGANKALQAFSNQENSVTKLRAAMAQNAILTDENVASYKELASEMQDLTGIGDEEWLKVLAKLTQFGSKPETIGMDIKAVENLAGALGRGPESLAEAAVLVGKVLQGNTGALSEYGITADQTLPKAEQIADVLAKINAIGGGQLQAMSKTLSGEWGRMTGVLGDLWESLGSLIDRLLPLREIMRGLTHVFSAWIDILPKAEDAVVDLDNKQKLSNRTLEETKAAAEAHAKRLEDIKSEAGKAASEISAMTTALREQQAQQDKMDNANMALELSNINLRKQSGQITGDQALLLETQVRGKYERQKQAREQETLRKEIQFAQSAIDEATTALQAAEGDLKKLEEAGPLFEKLKKHLELENQAQSVLSDLDQQLKEAETAFFRDRGVNQYNKVTEIQAKRAGAIDMLNTARSGRISAEQSLPENLQGLTFGDFRTNLVQAQETVSANQTALTSVSTARSGQIQSLQGQLSTNEQANQIRQAEQANALAGSLVTMARSSSGENLSSLVTTMTQAVEYMKASGAEQQQLALAVATLRGEVAKLRGQKNNQRTL